MSIFNYGSTGTESDALAVARWVKIGSVWNSNEMYKF